MNDVSLALDDFTLRFCNLWQKETGNWPASDALYGLPSPCIVSTTGNYVCWRPQPFAPVTDLSSIERALDIVLQSAIHPFYTTQFAGDMPACYGSTMLTLLQAWNVDDFARVQENLIGHLVMQKRLKLSPTLFLATTEDEMDIISLCNLTGNVVLEKIGRPRRTVLAVSLPDFLNSLSPVVI